MLIERFKQNFNTQSSAAVWNHAEVKATIENMDNPNRTTQEVGKRLDSLIKASGMNYVEFGKLVARIEGPDSKVGPATVLHWRKTGKIARGRLGAICLALKITPDVLLGVEPAIAAESCGVELKSLPSAAASLPSPDVPADLIPQTRALVEQIITKSKEKKLSEGDIALLISTVTQLSEDK